MVTHRSGFTLVELAAIVTVATALAGTLAIGMQTAGDTPATKDTVAGSPAEIAQARALSQRMTDATNNRAIVTALITWGTGDNDRFPLPSRFDAKDATVSLNGRAKDTTANILSMMIYNGMVTAEQLISPAEVNPNIKLDERYQFTDPKAAMRPAEALWDPGFKADFSKDQTANNSYAHLQPSDGRLPRWAPTFNASEPVVGNRGPELASVECVEDGLNRWSYAAKLANPESLTLKIHGPEDSWEGNIAFADGHVEFQTRIAPDHEQTKPCRWLDYATRDNSKRLDCYFYDELDDKNGSNAFLGIFTTAGKSAKDYRAIWD